MANDHVQFGISIPEIFTAGFNGWRNNIVPLTLAGLVMPEIASPVPKSKPGTKRIASRFMMRLLSAESV